MSTLILSGLKFKHFKIVYILVVPTIFLLLFVLGQWNHARGPPPGMGYRNPIAQQVYAIPPAQHGAGGHQTAQYFHHQDPRYAPQDPRYVEQFPRMQSSQPMHAQQGMPAQHRASTALCQNGQDAFGSRLTPGCVPAPIQCSSSWGSTEAGSPSASESYHTPQSSLASSPDTPPDHVQILFSFKSDSNRRATDQNLTSINLIPNDLMWLKISNSTVDASSYSLVS